MTIKSKQKIFISYSHKDEVLMQRVINHLETFDLDFDTWVDKNIDPGDEWEEKIKNAIDEADMAILLVSNDFLISDFIKSKELPWLGRKRELYKLRIIPFILKPSNWSEFEFYKKLEVRPKEKSFVEFAEDNGEREKVLKEFAKKVNLLLQENTSDLILESKKVIENNNGFYNSFPTTFAIYRVLSLHNENEEYYFKLTSNLSIYKKGTEYPIEIWRFIDGIDKIEDYSNIMRESFHKEHKNTSIGLVQNDRLSGMFSELSNFFGTLAKLRDMDKDTVEKMIKTFYNSSDISTFVNTFFEDKIKNLSFLDSNADATVSIFLFTNFHLLGFTSNELRQNIFKLIVEKYKIQLTEDGSNLFAIEAFLNVFEDALSYIKVNKNNHIDFQSLISKIDILKLPLPNENDLKFIEKNIDLVEKNISSIVDVNIKNLYIESKARFYYNNNELKYEDVENISNWLEREIASKDFLILLGDFGHGKTTLFKYMTAKLSKEYNHKKSIPVYLSLREHFTKGSSLKDAVTNAVMPRHKMTDDFWNQNSWLIFCDGFDELGIYHQDEPNWITLVFTTLLNESKKENIKILLSSRPVLFLDQNVKKDTVNNFDRLILKPFDEQQIEEWLNNWNKVNQDITIDMIKQRNILEIAKTPVILFLIASIFHEELEDENINYTKSQVYKKFFDWTAKTGGHIQEGESIKHPVSRNYRDILQEIAWQIFTHLDSKSGMLHYELLLKQLSAKFEHTSNKFLDNFLNEKIFVAHAFKESVPEHIEFMHQSLREYLVAEKIFNVFYDYCIKDFSESPVYSFNYNNLLLTQPITQAKLDFIRDMIESLDKEQKDKLINVNRLSSDWNSLIESFISSNTEILKASNNYLKVDSQIVQVQTYGNNLTIVTNIIILEFIFKVYVKGEVDFNELRKTILSLDSNDELYIFKNLMQKTLKKLSFYEVNIDNLNFDNFELNENIFLGVTFEKCSFKKTSFNDTTICESGSPLYANPSDEYEAKIPTPTEFKNCIFDNIELFHTTFRTVIFENCFFYNYKGDDEFLQEDVEYLDCQFFDSIFSYDFFKGAIFSDCIFINSKFIDMQNEKIHDIKFDNCILKKSNKWTEIDNETIWTKEGN